MKTNRDQRAIIKHKLRILIILLFFIALSSSIDKTSVSARYNDSTERLLINSKSERLIGAYSQTIDPPTFLLEWGSKGAGDGQFDNPHGIAVDSMGNVYVTDHNNFRIQKFDNNGNFLLKWGSEAIGLSEFIFPVGIAVDNSGNVYVTDTYEHRILKFDSNGNFLSQWGTYGEEVGQFIIPFSIAADLSGYLYVVDIDNYRVQKFDSTGNYIAQWGTYGTGPSQFNDPTGIVADSFGSIYVADRGSDRVQKFDSIGSYISEWGTQGDGDGMFEYPYGLAVDGFGYIHVTDTTNHYAQIFDDNGNFLTRWGSQGTGESQFEEPRGIAVDNIGNIFVVDSGNYRIQKFSTPTDTTPPSKINNLLANPGNDTGSIELSWTAPGDDGDIGTASSYIVRYDKSAITTESAWSSATNVSGEPTPKPAGDPESFPVTGLNSGEMYYFAIKAQDDVGNISELSNSPSEVATPIIIPPTTFTVYGSASVKFTDFHQNDEEDWVLLKGARVELIRNGEALTSTYTSLDRGVYQFKVQNLDPSDKYRVRVILSEGNHNPPLFQVFSDDGRIDANYLVYGETNDFFLKSGDEYVVKNVVFSSEETITNLRNYPQLLGDLAVIYYHTQQVIDFITSEYPEGLGVELDHDLLPVEIYAFKSSTSKVVYSPTDTSIIIGDLDDESLIQSRDRPMNREWHEMFHHLMENSIKLPLEGSGHCGIYNETTADSWAEGWSEAWATIMQDQIDYPNTEYSHLYTWGQEQADDIYGLNGHTVSLEYNFRVWDTIMEKELIPCDLMSGVLSLEELAVASLVWDLYDEKNVHDTDSYNHEDWIQLDLQELWEILTYETTTNSLENIRQLYESLSNREKLTNDSDKDDISDLDELFIMHGFFGDTWPWDTVYQSYEEVGYGGKPDRPDFPGIPGAAIKVDLIDDNRSPVKCDIGSCPSLRVEIVFGPPNEYFNYTYDFAFDQGSDNLIGLVLPPTRTVAAANMSLVTGGFPEEIFTIDNQTFWSAVATTENDYIAEATFTYSPRLYLPITVKSYKTNFCEEPFTKSKVWEGELDWACDDLIKKERFNSIRLETEVFSDAEVYSPLIPVTPNQTYEVSYWVKTNLVIDNAAVYGRVVPAQYTNLAQENDAINENRIDAGFIKGENVGGETDWVRKSYKFTTDSKTYYVRLRAPMGLYGRAKGQVWFDGVLFALSCEENFSKTKIWEGNLSWSCDTYEKKEGVSSIRLETEVPSDAEVYSKLIPIIPNELYKVSYWVKTDLIVDTSTVYGRVIAAQYSNLAQESDAVNENRIDAGFTLGKNVGGTTDWVHKTYTFSTSSNTYFVRFRAPMGLAGRAEGQVWFDGVTIERVD